MCTPPTPPTPLPSATSTKSTTTTYNRPEYLCWDVLGIDYVEVRISTREAAPAAGYLDALEARARALGVQWSGALNVRQGVGAAGG